mgnify:CR=1 FL=1
MCGGHGIRAARASSTHAAPLATLCTSSAPRNCGIRPKWHTAHAPPSPLTPGGKPASNLRVYDLAGLLPSLASTRCSAATTCTPPAPTSLSAAGRTPPARRYKAYEREYYSRTSFHCFKDSKGRKHTLLHERPARFLAAAKRHALISSAQALSPPPRHCHSARHCYRVRR